MEDLLENTVPNTVQYLFLLSVDIADMVSTFVQNYVDVAV
jgi:hypothetical protein